MLCRARQFIPAVARRVYWATTAVVPACVNLTWTQSWTLPGAACHFQTASMPSIEQVFDEATGALHTELFDQDIPVPCLVVPCRHLGVARKGLAQHLLTERNVLPIQPIPDGHPVLEHADVSQSSHKLLMLSKTYVGQPIPEAVQAWVEAQPLPILLSTRTLSLGWASMSAAEILRELIPSEVEVSTAFEAVGHIAHLNLIGDQLKYGKLIAAVILDKNPALTMVVNKVGSIHAQYRTFDMEVLACKDPEPNFVVQLREQGCAFKFNYRSVYWNSRLNIEHERVVKSIMPEIEYSTAPGKKRERNPPQLQARHRQPLHVLDACAGVGPFALPLAKNGARVTANDLNPESFKWLQENAEKNKLAGELLPLNGDARDCIRAEFAGERPTPAWPYASHVLMNLPASALEFCDVFADLFSAELWRAPANEAERHVHELGPAAGPGEKHVVPRVHCYCFSQHHEHDEAIADVTERLCKVLRVDTGAEVQLDVRPVRDVGPNKIMCVAQFSPPVRAVAGSASATAAAPAATPADEAER